MIYIQKKSSSMPANGNIIDDVNINNKIDNTYSANAANEKIQSINISEYQLPNGFAMEFAGKYVPEGYVWANGSVLPIDLYPKQYAIFGDSFGTGTIPAIDGSTINLFRQSNVGDEGIYKMDVDILPEGTFNFKIGTHLYTAEYGMTWKDWLISKYNTDGWRMFLILFNSIIANFDEKVYVAVYPNTAKPIENTFLPDCNGVENHYIIPNAVYDLYLYDTGGNN